MKTLITLIFFIVIDLNINAQLLPYNPRDWDTNWSYTIFSEDFSQSSLDLNKWNVVENFGRGNCIFIDSVGATYEVVNGILNLSMLKKEGYSYYNDEGQLIWPEFIAAEIHTIDKFKYGIYEGRMQFSSNSGSWPAFWFFGGDGAEDPQYNQNGYASEIDIAELNWRKNWLGTITSSTDHVFHWWWPKSIYGSKEMDIGSKGKQQNNVNWNNWHIFKLIYTPYFIKFFIDGNLSFQRSRFYFGDNDISIEDLNNYPIYYEYPWYPKHQGHIILSQQVTKKSIVENPMFPQTSKFDWISFRKFFLSPTITCPDIICTSGNAILDVDALASNIQWSLSPGYLFSGSLTGTGKNVTIVANNNDYHGMGTIKYTFNMPSGEAFFIEKQIRVKGPGYEDITFFVCKSDGSPVNNYSGNWVLCPNTTYHIYVNNNGPCSTSNYLWTVPSSWSTFYTWNNMISINTNSSPGGPVQVQANACCNNFLTIKQDYFGSDYNCGNYFMNISPNPTTNESNITIESFSDELQVDEDINWEIEVYDHSFLIKERNKKIKGKTYKLKTSGWKDGIYIVRINYKNEILQEKLVIKNN
jgi:hypothetical protein